MITVTYRFPIGTDATKLANIIAVGQTVGSWGAEFAHRANEMAAHSAQVIDITQQEDGSQLARIAFPRINTENDIASLLTMIFGKFSLAGPARVMAIELPDDYGTSAKFGIAGIRKILNIHDRPFIMGIFKPALGLSAQDHADLLGQVAPEGLDIIKDDEINFDLRSASTLERVQACQPILEELRQKQGRELLYAVNISGRADQIIDNARRLIDVGANALLLNVLCYGYPILEALANHPDVQVPIFTHPALAGAIGGATDGSSDYGIDYSVLLGTLMAYAGADAVLVPAHYGSLPFAAESEFRIRDILRTPPSGRPAVLPVPSAGINPGVTRRALQDYGNDVALNAGAAIFDHPMGAAAGVRAFYQALQAIENNLPLKAERIEQPELKSALEKWGGE